MRKFSSIDCFRVLHNEVLAFAEYCGKDEQGNVIRDTSKSKPTIWFTGTVKLHGTNFGYVDTGSSYYFQSKDRVISVQEDNAGSAAFGERHIDAFKALVNQLRDENGLAATDEIVVYMEFVGKGVNKNVGVSNLPKSAFLLSACVIKDETREYLSIETLPESDGIYNITKYFTNKVCVDFNAPYDESQFEPLVNMIETECPVTKQLLSTHPDYDKMSKIGEGMVFEGRHAGKIFRFKIKGEKHAARSRVKKEKVDDPNLQAKLYLAEKVTPSWRLEQMLSETFNLMNGGTIDRRLLGKYILAVLNDVMKEDKDLIVNSGFEWKEVSSHISTIAREYFFLVESGG